MNRDSINPCDCCPAKNKASGCNNCVLYTIATHGECQNDKCFCNYECGCLLGLDNVCKASTEYKDDLFDHTCSECASYTSGVCDKTGDNVYWCDTACEDFKEREE